MPNTHDSGASMPHTHALSDQLSVHAYFHRVKGIGLCQLPLASLFFSLGSKDLRNMPDSSFPNAGSQGTLKSIGLNRRSLALTDYPKAA